MARQQEEQRQMQMRMQEEEQQRLFQQKQQEEQQRMFQQMMMQQEEQQRQQQLQMQQQQQMQMQQQQMQMQQQQTQQTQQIQQTQHIQQTQQTQQTQSSTLERIAKQGGFSYGAIPTKGSQPQQQPALPPMSSTSLSSQSQSSQSQHMSSVQQSSTSFSSHQQSRNEMYESQEFNGGVMKGYKRKDDMSSNEMRVTNTNGRDSAIFGGINGDANSFVADECDYKKHTVKDLANHFALVKPEQRMFNGDQAPQLNYLGANEAGAMVQSQTARREVSQQDIEASKMAYEMKKKQQQEAAQQQSSTT